MSEPEYKPDPLFQLLRQGQIEEFNRRREQGEPCDLIEADLRHLDLRALDPRGLDMSGSYLRDADLRGLDLRQTRLDGASVHNAKIAGTWFPAELSAEEINLSLVHGTRMRYRA
ncbi:MAG: pentapeptide repeat-containing protein [Chromatiales bacterium]|jgi:uncharacterized protein YjbI with pentapeptide repeats